MGHQEAITGGSRRLRVLCVSDELDRRRDLVVMMNILIPYGLKLAKLSLPAHLARATRSPMRNAWAPQANRTPLVLIDFPPLIGSHQFSPISTSGAAGELPPLGSRPRPWRSQT